METEESRLKAEPLSKECRRSDAACFDCNICLESASDPVVTSCGHLYCWPCIYRWLHARSASARQCPVCKAPLSENCLVPLYGRGVGTVEEESYSHPKVPRRPSVRHDRAVAAPAVARAATPVTSRPHLHHYYHSRQSVLAAPVFQSTAGGILGGIAEAVMTWRYGDSGSRWYYGGRYRLTVAWDRRQLMKVERYLQQACFLLFLCMVLCLLLF